jgi:hyperosmotically inducible periplasmic protein
MNKIWKERLPLLALGLLMAIAPGFGFDKGQNLPSANPTAPEAYLQKQVRHELLMLPYYSVFDNLEFRVDGRDVELLGQVRYPVLKSDAQNVVQHIEGVGTVTNNIQVLPLSNFDDRIRRTTYQAVFSGPGLYRYAMGANPSIHIIVDNGHVTLVGYVGNAMDKSLAYMRANSVPGVFSVTNDLRID